MAAGPGNALSRQVRRAARLPDPDDLTDGQLLARFLADRDEAAFEALVRRHAAMVLGVCRRVTGNAADADDAFQAAFVVLVRRGRELAGRGTVGDWLYGVAYRTGLKARAMAVKRRAREQSAARSVEAPPAADPPDWLPVLDEELSRLPQKYREPLVLCELEGRSRKEVAGRLGVPEGTLSSRLAAAKKMLADRLRKRGVTAPATLLAAAVEQTASAVPPVLLHSTTRAASGAASDTVHRLVTEVTRMMFLTKLRAGALVLAVALVGSALGMTALSRAAADPLEGAKPARTATDKSGAVTVRLLREKEEEAKKTLRGTWLVQKVLRDGEVQENRKVENETFEFVDGTVKIHQELDGGRVNDVEYTFSVNPTTSPAELTLYSKNGLLMAIYELDGDSLKIANYGRSEIERPRSFSVKDKRVEDMPLYVWELKRKKPEKQPPAAAKADEPAWKKDFYAAYGLKDGEVIKRVAPPYPASRDDFFNDAYPRDVRIDYTNRFTAFRWKDGKATVGPGRTSVEPGKGVPLRDLIDMVADIPAHEVEGHEETLKLLVTGDFVLREGADPVKVAAQLQHILQNECKVDVTLNFREVEREVIVARGKFKVAPLDPAKKNYVEVYAVELTPDYAGGGGGPVPYFLRHLNAWVNQRFGDNITRIVNEAEFDPKEMVSWHFNMRSENGRATHFDADAEPTAVLKNVAAQTGLTFKTEKRKVRVLFVERK